MAFIFKRPNSPYWWISWDDPSTKTRKRFSTGLKITDPNAHREAIIKRNEFTIKEARSASSTDHPFTEWAPDFLEIRHSDSPATRQRNLTVWKTICSYFTTRQISTPSQLRREDCLGYVKWRRTAGNFRSKRKKEVSINTILLELKVLSKVMQEAVVRGYISSNPALRLGLKKVPARQKAEFTDEQIQTVLAAIKAKFTAPRSTDRKYADFFLVSFEIARHQGIRMCETYLDLHEDVDLEHMELKIKAKGGKHFRVPMNPKLLPLFQRLRAEGRRFTYDKPFMPGKAWWAFFDILRKKDPSFNSISFHSTRVTVVSRMERAGAPEAVVMTMVNHASTTVHRIYRKVKQSELAPYWDAATGVPAESSPSSEATQQIPDAIAKTPAPAEKSSEIRD